MILELVGAPHFPGNLEALAPKGRIVIVGVGGGQEITLPLLTLMQRRATIRGTVLRARPLEEKGTVVRAFEKEVVPALASGRMRPLVDSVFAADEVGGGLRQARRARQDGQGAASSSREPPRAAADRRTRPEPGRHRRAATSKLRSSATSRSGAAAPGDASSYGAGARSRRSRYRGKPGHYSATIAINQLDAADRADPAERRAEHLPRVSRAGGRGLHHLGFWVDSVEESIGRWRRPATTCIQAGFGYGLDGDGGYAYFDTEPIRGDPRGDRDPEAPARTGLHLAALAAATSRIIDRLRPESSWGERRTCDHEQAPSASPIADRIVEDDRAGDHDRDDLEAGDHRSGRASEPSHARELEQRRQDGRDEARGDEAADRDRAGAELGVGRRRTTPRGAAPRPGRLRRRRR